MIVISSANLRFQSLFSLNIFPLNSNILPGPNNKHVTQRPVIVGGNVIEEVQSYIYLGQRVSLLETGMANEINRRIQAGWKSFNDHKIVLKSNVPNSLKKKLYNQCVLPAMTYAISMSLKGQ